MAFPILDTGYSHTTPLKHQWADTYDCIVGAEAEQFFDFQYQSIETPNVPGTSAFNDMAFIPQHHDLNAVNIKVIARYLRLLGYSWEHSKSAKDVAFDAIEPDIQSDPKFQAAVQTFQQEANLTVDQWIGDQTWRALQALVGFESHTDIQRWQNADGSFCRAFSRAVQLRLWTYGLASKPPAQGFSRVTQRAKEKFKTILWSIDLLDTPTASVDEPWLYAQLFDSDRLLESAAQATSSHSFHNGPINQLQHQAEIGINLRHYQEAVALKGRFIANQVKIELWLLGGDATIDGKGDIPVKGLGKVVEEDDGDTQSLEIIPFRMHKSNRTALEHYRGMLHWDASITEITPELLKSFLEPEAAYTLHSEPFNESDFSQKLLEKLEVQEDHGKSFIEKAFESVKKVGMKLWDGIKRVWRWIKGGIHTIVEGTTNMLRSIFRFAHKAYKAVRLAFHAFMLSIGQYMDGIIHTGSPTITIAISKDFDTTVAFHQDTPPHEIATATLKVQRFSAMFHLSCAIISNLITILTSVATGFIGWVKLTWALIKSYRNIRPHYRHLSDLLARSTHL